MTPLYPQKLALTSPTGGGRSVGIVRSRTKATEFVCLHCLRNSLLTSVFTSKVEGLFISSTLAESHTHHSALCFFTLFLTLFSLAFCNFLPPRYKFHTRQTFLRIFKILYSIWKRGKVSRVLYMTPVLICKLLNNLKEYN